uniref:uncharacterized protein n=1 Tax=Pristiophorus japonicus TaxID=55135 RepID=UPI00398F1A46
MDRPTPGVKVFFRTKGANRMNLVELPCGDFVDCGNLAVWSQWMLDQGYGTFPCTQCADPVPWQLVRQLSALTTAEERDCEKRLANICPDSLKQCPLCARLVQRVSGEMLRVECPACPGQGRKDHGFCWECGRAWRGAAMPGERCGRADCCSTALLQSCPTLYAPRSPVHCCPAVRKCPRCPKLIAHSGGCNMVTCPGCVTIFCYRCLTINRYHSPNCTIQPNPRPL